MSPPGVSSFTDHPTHPTGNINHNLELMLDATISTTHECMQWYNSDGDMDMGVFSLLTLLGRQEDLDGCYSATAFIHLEH